MARKSPITYKTAFPIINQIVNETMERVSERGMKIPCRRGCNHCCYLLVEISMGEAQELASWIRAQPPRRRQLFEGRIRREAEFAREYFRQWPTTERCAEPMDSDDEIPGRAFGPWFYDHPRPCPFLYRESCAAYEARPVPCRLHFVTSPARLCRPDVVDDSAYEVPRLAAYMKNRVNALIEPLEKNEPRGHLPIMVEEALDRI